MQINTRADLEALRGTPRYRMALEALHGAMTITVDVTQYPGNYGDPGYDGPMMEPRWETRERPEAIERLGLTREELERALAEARRSEPLPEPAGGETILPAG